MRTLRNKIQNNGITLIALVITVIVLLILAGVSIATLTGDNGILTQLENAKNKSKEAEAFERVGVEIAGSYGTKGKIDLGLLNDNLRKNVKGLTYNGVEISEDDSNRITALPATVQLNGYDIAIRGNGEVGKPNIVDKIIVNPTAYYGKKVTNYKASDSDTNIYRIFYVDRNNDFGDGFNTIYLKADYSSTNYNSNDYESYDSVNTKVREMNPEWAKGKKADSDTKTRGESEFENSKAETKIVTWNENEQVAAYLCSPVNEANYANTLLPWKEYYNSEYANYVIGGPSVEMYVKSYNEAYKGKINDNTKYPIGATYRVASAPGYIYTLNGARSTISNMDCYTGTDSIDYQNYNSMYCGKTENGIAKKTGQWWLASPSADRSDYVCTVYGGAATLSGRYYGNGTGVSPLVSLKSSFIPEVE